ncbi:MAG TPA: right-handed parallel beta-helix repeat-containing protein [Anaerolineales bacterium]|nr:right-handed parallel beta-helix repeat-containing protein [Anaerolineales bacterium]
MLDGIYTQDTMTVPSGVNVQAVAGSRPVVIHSDGSPPGLQFGAGCSVTGVWFGGTKFADENGRIINFLSGGGATVDGCTFFGYSQGMGGWVGSSNLITKNRFVNCGYDGLWHDIYCSNSGNTEISEGIHVGGAGYKIHLYNNPEGLTIRANFMGGSTVSDMAIQQGNDTIANNILWGEVVASYWNAENCIFSKNIFGPDRAYFTDVSSNNTADGNVFCNGQTPFGTNPQTWDAAAIATNLGKTKSEIDMAISTLIAAFSQTVQQIHDDAMIETHFATLKAVIDAWKLQ